MAEVLLDWRHDTSVTGKLLGLFSHKTQMRVNEDNIRQINPDMTTATSVDLLTFQQMLLDYKQTEERVEELGILEIPDVFNLKPLSSQRVTFTVRETKPASFYFISEGEDTEE